jgi:hypothetical protein
VSWKVVIRTCSNHNQPNREGTASKEQQEARNSSLRTSLCSNRGLQYCLQLDVLDSSDGSTYIQFNASLGQQSVPISALDSSDTMKLTGKHDRSLHFQRVTYSKR